MTEAPKLKHGSRHSDHALFRGGLSSSARSLGLAKLNLPNKSGVYLYQLRRYERQHKSQNKENRVVVGT